MSTVGVKVIVTSGRTLRQGKSMEVGKLTDEYRDAVAVCAMDATTLTVLGLSEGDPVRVETLTGSVIVRSKLSRMAEPGVVFIPCGPYVNALVQSDTQHTGMPDYKGIEATVFPAKGEKISSIEELVRTDPEVSK